MRHSWEAKTDGTYFLSNVLGGDHSLKFGVGWRRNPIMIVLALQRRRARHACSASATTAPTAATATPSRSARRPGFVPLPGDLYRDQLRNNDWWTYNGYIQDSLQPRPAGASTAASATTGRRRSTWAAACPTNVIVPDLLPAQCEDATEIDSITGKKIQSFSNWSPRMSATYDLIGNGKTSVKASGSYYYDTKITLANASAACSRSRR